MLRIICICVLLAVVACVVSGYVVQQESQDFEDLAQPAEGYGSEYNYPMRKRGLNFCARWSEYCVPNAKLKFAQCCTGLRCICGKFWTQGKCQCKSGNILGR